MSWTRVGSYYKEMPSKSTEFEHFRMFFNENWLEIQGTKRISCNSDGSGQKFAQNPKNKDLRKVGWASMTLPQITPAQHVKTRFFVFNSI